jgi:glycosyltransferase involved in cell wall biosynthesis
MQVLHFDARFIRLDHQDGISRFSVELIKALAIKVKVIAIIYDLRQLEHLPKGIEFVLLNNPQSPLEMFIARKLNELGATHVFSPMQIMGTAGRKYKLVLTLHDLIYYRHRRPPQDLNFLVQLIWRVYHLTYLPQRLLLNRADAVATVSKTTKNLIEQHNLTKRRLGVVYNAAPGKPTTAARSMPSSKSLLYIGSFMPYKNVETLVRAMAMLPDFELHLLSKIDKSRRSELQELAESIGSKVVFHSGVSDEEYRRLLMESFALVSASRDEGFGIPLVEAMQQGTPVVVSDLEIFREVAGDAGRYFSADQPEELAKRIMELGEPKAWVETSKKSIDRAKLFDWNASADELLELFRKIG